jgi:hypothetical protein
MPRGSGAGRLKVFIAEMKAKGVGCSGVQERVGVTDACHSAGGGQIGVYQPKHASPLEGAR